MGFFSSFFGEDKDRAVSGSDFKAARTQARADKAFARGKTLRSIELAVKAHQQETNVPWWRR